MSTDLSILAADNARLLQELAELRQQQAATGEMLEIISRSPTDLQSVLDAVAKSAARLCDAFGALILSMDGGRLRQFAHHGPMPSGPVGEYSIPHDRAVCLPEADRGIAIDVHSHYVNALSGP